MPLLNEQRARARLCHLSSGAISAGVLVDVALAAVSVLHAFHLPATVEERSKFVPRGREHDACGQFL
jgi:hypothetical protein